jgi:hypothetical protein
MHHSAESIDTSGGDPAPADSEPPERMHAELPPPVHEPHPIARTLRANRGVPAARFDGAASVLDAPAATLLAWSKLQNKLLRGRP